jgi:ADP-ribosylglycohydrolase
MRAPILGVCLGSEPDKLMAFNRASTRLTHTDPKAEWGSLAVALAAHRSAESRSGTALDPGAVVDELVSTLRATADPAAADLVRSLDAIPAHIRAGHTTEEYAAALGLTRGVTGYMYHTVPVAVYGWLRYQDDFPTSVQAAIRCGGDTDTVAAITGALVGARVGKGGIPPAWLRGVIDWPRTMRWVEALAERIGEGKWRTEPQSAHPLAVWALPARNALFFAWVLVHAARRLLPPY